MQDTTQSNAVVQTSTDLEVDPLAREVADLRAELEAMRAHVMGQNAGPEPDTALGRRDQSPKRRLGRRRNNGSDDASEPSGLVSRRRLFGLLGGAAAAGAGLAVAGSTLGADPAGATAVTAGAADGDGLSIGNSNSCTSTTSLTSATPVNAFIATASGSGGRGILGIANNGTDAIGVEGFSGSGIGLYGVGGRAPLQLQAASTAGAPTTGTHLLGEFFVDSNGVLFQCILAGLAGGTWVRQSPLVTLPSPARVYDSRVGQLPATGPKTPITNGSTVNVNVTGTQAAGGGPSGVPAAAKSVLGNVTLVNRANPGVFLTIFAFGGSQPATSNVNAGSGVVVANNFTSQLGMNSISINCGGGPTDFIIDIFGYYP